MNKLMAAALVAAVACGCVSVNKNDGGEACLTPPIVKDAVYEKYDVGTTPVTSKGVAVGVLGFIIIGDAEATHWADDVAMRSRLRTTIEVAKNNAYSKACEANGCDSIVGARYNIKRTNYFVYDQVIAEITGYPAKMTGIEVIKAPMPACPAKQ